MARNVLSANRLKARLQGRSTNAEEEAEESQEHAAGQAAGSQKVSGTAVLEFHDSCTELLKQRRLRTFSNPTSRG